MDVNELNRISELVWSTLNSIKNAGINRDEQIELIKPIILKTAKESRKVGRSQIINHLKIEIDILENT